MKKGCLNIPCVIRPPGGVKGWKSRALTDLLDISASLTDIAGAPSLKGGGLSLLPKIKDGPSSPLANKGKGAVFSEVMGYSMALTERYKMAVETKTRQPLELYDLENDPKELRNLVNDPALEKVRSELLDEHFKGLFKYLDGRKLRELEENRSGTRKSDALRDTD
jgi:arylsulfatase A-like enzyme